MTITCPRCRSIIPPESIDIQTSVAKCNTCGKAFNFTAQKVDPVNVPPKPILALPKGYSIATEGADLVITRRWFTWPVLVLLFISLAWDGMVAFRIMPYIDDVISNPNQLSNPLSWILGSPWILFALVGLVFTYFSLAALVNVTVIRVNDVRFSVHHSPLPFPGNLVIPSRSITQLYCAEKLMQADNQAPTPFYYLYLCTVDGRRRKLSVGGTTPDQMLFLEQQIERHLGITDRPVAGEMRKP